MECRQLRRDGQRGFTLFELLIGLTVVAMLAASAVGMQTFFRRQVLVTETNLLITHLNLARTEALTRRSAVTICKSRDGLRCHDDGEWGNGYIVFSDNNDDNDRDAEEPVIRHASLAPGVALQWNASGFGARRNVHVSYQASGFSGKNGTFLLCDRESQQMRAVAVIQTGRARLKEPNERDRERCARQSLP